MQNTWKSFLDPGAGENMWHRRHEDVCVHESKSTPSHPEHTMTLPRYHKEKKVTSFSSFPLSGPPLVNCVTHIKAIYCFPSVTCQLITVQVSFQKSDFSKIRMCSQEKVHLSCREAWKEKEGKNKREKRQLLCLNYKEVEFLCFSCCQTNPHEKT